MNVEMETVESRIKLGDCICANLNCQYCPYNVKDLKDVCFSFKMARKIKLGLLKAKSEMNTEEYLNLRDKLCKEILVRNGKYIYNR